MVEDINSQSHKEICNKYNNVTLIEIFDLSGQSTESGDVIDFAVASDYQGQIIFPTYESSEWAYTAYGGMSYMIIENMG